MQKSSNTRFRKTSIKPGNDINFDSDTLKLYLAIDEKKPVLEIFKETMLERSVFKECLLKLYKLKLIEQVEEEVDYVENSFLNRLREVLIDVSGPLGGILMEEAAEDMNLELNKVPKAKVADFVYQVASDIPGEKQAAEFKKIMLQEIKNLDA